MPLGKYLPLANGNIGKRTLLNGEKLKCRFKKVLLASIANPVLRGAFTLVLSEECMDIKTKQKPQSLTTILLRSSDKHHEMLGNL
jgi:hypothetical protein